jgi:hypothetical protein
VAAAVAGVLRNVKFTASRRDRRWAAGGPARVSHGHTDSPAGQLLAAGNLNLTQLDCPVTVVDPQPARQTHRCTAAGGTGPARARAPPAAARGPGYPARPGPAGRPVVALQRGKMEWLIGSSEVDLSPAERAINQLSEDKDAIEEKLKALQEESAKQQYVLHYADITTCCDVSCKFTFGRKHLQELADAIEKAKNDEKRYVRNCHFENRTFTEYA